MQATYPSAKMRNVSAWRHSVRREPGAGMHLEPETLMSVPERPARHRITNLQRYTPRVQPDTRQRYVTALRAAAQSAIPFLIGGAYALGHHTGIRRWTKDLDLFVRPEDVGPLLAALRSAGLETEVTFPHWLAKAHLGEDTIDVIFSSGNGVARVDDDWFAHSVPTTVMGVRARLCPPEEMIWSKAFIMERERYDGADIAHLIRACHARLDWDRLLARFGPDWRVLLSHLALFGYVYPAERRAVPDSVMQTLARALIAESTAPAPRQRICRGTLLSRQQYLTDIRNWPVASRRKGTASARTPPRARSRRRARACGSPGST